MANFVKKPFDLNIFLSHLKYGRKITIQLVIHSFIEQCEYLIIRWKESDKDLRNKLTSMAQKEAEVAHLEEEVALLKSELEGDRRMQSELLEKSGEIEELQSKLR